MKKKKTGRRPQGDVASSPARSGGDEAAMPTTTNRQSTTTNDADVYYGHDESDDGTEDGHAHNDKHDIPGGATRTE